jgi:hypothetical protein
MTMGLGALALGLMVASSGCAAKTVNDVLADPSRYADRHISLEGRVVESFSVTGRGFYRIEDATGKLWVFSLDGVPRRGASVRVKGRVYDGFDLTSLGGFLDLPEPIQERIETGLLLMESSHKAAF